jgi:hypothetical protein
MENVPPILTVTNGDIHIFCTFFIFLKKNPQNIFLKYLGLPRLVCIRTHARIVCSTALVNDFHLNKRIK